MLAPVSVAKSLRKGTWLGQLIASGERLPLRVGALARESLGKGGGVAGRIKGQRLESCIESSGILQ